MRTLIVDKESSELRYQGLNLTVYCAGKRVNSVAIKQLERVIVSPHVIITAGVLGVIAEQHLSLLVLNARLPQRTAQLANDYSGDIERRLLQYRVCTQQPEFCLQAAIRLVILKIERQRTVLQRALAKRPELNHDLTHAVQQLTALLVQLTEPGIKQISTLNGLEGAAAMLYFHAYTQLFAASLHFTARNRRPPQDPVNAILSLSYTLIYHEAVNALKIQGLDPALGFYHQPCYGRQSLACDLIEPVRPYLDQWIWRLFAHQTLTATHFVYEDGGCFLTDAGKPIFYKLFFSYIKPIKRLLRYYALHWVNTLNEVN
ncbi:CRISPR-associated endonuclease Cas1 [Crenothrix polyspora]|uniref:CRISPR-associated endonuclease Cas1 n=1 Tax=Crenothrix polyspora TaxID=360316 RepID=A0A1R4H119_9GAMM|nr:CRISPR-associated endonuclease Cas1 [Crenothrix polyspora]SJM89902.1 CRISPR-associated endonuclease Cas1 [Crenothrix polyspora]